MAAGDPFAPMGAVPGGPATMGQMPIPGPMSKRPPRARHKRQGTRKGRRRRSRKG